jgi:hypothetical protein
MHISSVSIGLTTIMFTKHCTFERYLFFDKISYLLFYKSFIIICAIQGSIGKWKRCNFYIPFKHEINNSFPYHANLSRKGYRSLIYSGDHDMKVPFLATQAWIKSLNYSIVDDWRQWYSNDQVAGYAHTLRLFITHSDLYYKKIIIYFYLILNDRYTRTYSNQMTFATLKVNLLA